MKTLSFIYAIMLITFTSYGQVETETTPKVAPQIELKIMVVPKVAYGEDMRKFYDNNINVQIAISKIEEAFQNRGVQTISFDQAYNEIYENLILEGSSNAASDAKSMVLNRSNADVIVKVTVDVRKHPERNANSVFLLLEATQVGTSKVLASTPVPGPMIRTDDVGILTTAAIENKSEEFLNQIQANLNRILETGQSIYVKFTAVEDSKVDLDTKINGKRLSYLLEEWFKANVLDYKNSGVSKLQVTFSDVKIPLRDPKNPNKKYTGQSFFNEIEEYLDSIKVEFKRLSGTDNKIMILIL